MSEAFGYIRVSGTGQLKGDGPNRQRQSIQQYARRSNVSILRYYTDAYTGTEDDRPQFIALLEEAMANGCRVVVVEMLDRLARDLIVQNTLLAKLESMGITLISALTGEDVTASMREDPMRRALVQIQGVFAELERRLLVQKLRRGREAKRKKTGRCEGNKPFGHYPGEQDTLRRIRQLRRKPRGGTRRSIARVCEQLNREAFTNRAGEPWKRANLWLIMRRHNIP